MSLSHLSLVTPPVESAAARATRLLAEARDAANEQVRTLEQLLMEVSGIAKEIAFGGEIYPVGVRDLCRRLSEDAVAKSQTVEALLQSRDTAGRR